MESPSFARYWSKSKRMIPGKGDLHDYCKDILTDGDLLGPPPSYTLIRDPVLRLCHRMMAHSIARRSQEPKKVIVADLFYLRGLDVGSILGGLTVIAFELPIIDMGELARPTPPQHSRTHSSQTHDPSHPYLFFCIYLIKHGSKFSTIVHEYVTEPSRIFTLNARMGKRDDFKCVEAEDKSNLKTLL
ncbi:hypothetical protein Tco_0043570 [Tanacetum coccineum]